MSRRLHAITLSLAACCAPATPSGPRVPMDDARLAAEVPLDELFARGVELERRGELGMLDEARRVLVEEYLWVRAWQPPPSPARPEGRRARKPKQRPRPDLRGFLDDRGVPAALVDEATRVALATMRAGDHDAAHERVLTFHVEATIGRGGAFDAPLAHALARGLLLTIDPDPWIILTDARVVPPIAAALREPHVDPSVEELARQLRGTPPLPADRVALAAELARWWADEGPFLYLDTSVFYNDGEEHPDGWIVIDPWAMFVDDLARVGSAHGDDDHPTDDDPPAWAALPIERRRALARESLARRRADPTTWPAWLAARAAELGLPR